MLHYTLNDLMDFTQNERKMVKQVLPGTFEEESIQPSEGSLRNILDYSKALSVRKSKNLHSFRIVLN